jgi:hypothetical protein
LELKSILTAVLLSALLMLPAADAQPASIDIPGARIPIQILAQSPAETTTELQVICLFRSSPVNTLHGSLTETNEKLGGLLERIRKPDLFRGELGETLLITSPKGGLRAKRLLIIGLGDPQSFPAADGTGRRSSLYGGRQARGNASLFRPDHSRWRRHQVYDRRNR